MLIVGAIYVGYKDNWIKQHPKKYCYEDIRKLGYPNAVLVLTNLKHKDKYLKYYHDVESGIEPYLDNDLEFLFAPPAQPVYLLEVSEDSTLAKIHCYIEYEGDSRVKSGPGEIEGWVYYKTIHDRPFINARAVEKLPR